MKKITFLAAFSALLVAAPAWGEEAKKEAAKPEAVQREAAKPEASSVAKKPAATVAGKSKRAQDARHCLERSSNIEIIKCAEEYL